MGNTASITRPAGRTLLNELVSLRADACLNGCPHAGAPWYCNLLGRSIRKDIWKPGSSCPDGRWIKKRFLFLRAYRDRATTWFRLRHAHDLKRRGGVFYYLDGALKLAVVAARLCRTPATAMIVRRASCRSCDKRREVRPLGLFAVDMCSPCGCFVRAKTALATQRCPKERWGAVEGERCDILARLPVVKGLAVAQRKCGGCGGVR